MSPLHKYLHIVPKNAGDLSISICASRHQAATLLPCIVMKVSSSHLIAVLGAGGPTGKLCVQQLLEIGASVRAVVRSPDNYKGVFAANPALDVIRGDVTDPESLSAALDGVTGIIFAASSSTYFGAKSVENEVRSPGNCPVSCNKTATCRMLQSRIVELNCAIPTGSHECCNCSSEDRSTCASHQHCFGDSQKSLESLQNTAE